MHQKVDDLFRNAGFSDRSESRELNSLFHNQEALQGQPHEITQESAQQMEQMESVTQSSSVLPSHLNSSITQSEEPQNTSSNGILSSISGAASNLLGGGNLLEGLLGGGLLGDLFSGISGLFGGGQSQPPPLVPYDAPQSQDFELAMGGGQIGDAVYNQIGNPRVAPVTEPALGGLQYLGSTSTQGSDSTAAGGSSGSQSSPQITLNVQAMDSQSFLDRSQDIAQAVRQAMLNMHSINDVINDL